MSDQEKEIDLGRTMDDSSPVAEKSSGKKHKYYPTLYISGVEGLDGLPKEGEATIYFKRTSMTARTDKDGEEEHSAELEVHKICFDEEKEASDENDADWIDGAAKKAGIKTEDEPKEGKEEDEDSEYGE